jgi:hypothetical protein
VISRILTAGVEVEEAEIHGSAHYHINVVVARFFELLPSKQEYSFLMFFSLLTTSPMLGLWSGEPLEHSKPISNVDTRNLPLWAMEDDDGEVVIVW